MLAIAFKEWAIICQALTLGRQALILRKGGIAESGGEFRPEYPRFWLYPTYLHEHRAGVKPEDQAAFDIVHAARPPSGRVRLSHFAEVASVHRIAEWEKVAALSDLHAWSEDAVRMKFQYRQPGLFVLPVRVFQANRPVELEETPAYAGCRTWVELSSALPTAGTSPVLTDPAFSLVHAEIIRRLGDS